MSPVDGKSADLHSRIQAHRAGVIHRSGNAAPSSAPPAKDVKGPAFGDILRSKVEELRFSAHASNRIKSRSIDLTPEIMSKLQKAVSGAERKGAEDSLILVKDLAFIVNIPNKTVITAMDGESIKDNVFTNIDSTVIAD
ncbi:MAG: TIGR02530 family flagellar biosynthesis protein [Chitinispirillaceae bacterium]